MKINLQNTKTLLRFRFDILVNGGGAVTLQFQRNPYKPEIRTIMVAWNRIVVLERVVLRLGDDGASMSSMVRDWTASGALRSSMLRSGSPSANQSCGVQQLEGLRPQVVQSDTRLRRDSTHSGKSFLLTDTQVGQLIRFNPVKPVLKQERETW